MRPLRAFRQHLGITRDALAHAVGTASSNPEKYEADLPPHLIEKLEAYARSIDREDAVPILRGAFPPKAENSDITTELRRLADEQARLHGLIEAQVVRVVNSGEKKLLERIVALAHRRDFMKRLEAFVKAEEMVVGQEMIARELEKKKAG